MGPEPREIVVAPDHFEVVAEDVVLLAELDSGVAVCVYDAVEEAGALLHLRFVERGPQLAEATDTTLATELLLLDRCVEALRQVMPNARDLQARIAVHLRGDERARAACEPMLMLVRHVLGDAGATVPAPDVAFGAVRQLRFRPALAHMQLR